VNLLDGDGAVVETTTTSGSGRFKFTGLDLGVWRVRSPAAPGWVQTTPDPADIAVTRGMRVNGLTFGFAKSTSPPPGYTAQSQPVAAPASAPAVAPSSTRPEDADPALRQLLDETDAMLHSLSAGASL
jgi:hypothetical protein